MMLTKDELKAAIVASVAKLGHVPSRAELLKQAGVTPRHIRKHFGTYRSALEACGHERSGSGKKVLMQSLFQDWSEIVRTLKKVPTLVEYEQRSRYSVRPLMRVFSTWTNVPDGMKLYAEGEGLAEEYKDVLDVIEHRTVREYDVPQGVRANVRAEDLEGPADVWPAVTGVSAGVCANERGRGAVSFWGPVRTAGLFCSAGPGGISGLRGDARGSRKPVAASKN
jgi:hypothetical protein